MATASPAIEDWQRAKRQAPRKRMLVGLVTRPQSLLTIQSLLIKVDQVWDAFDVPAIRNSHFPFSRFQARGHAIPPAEFRDESVPDKNVPFVHSPALFKAPFQDFFVGAALFNPLDQIAMIDSEKIA